MKTVCVTFSVVLVCLSFEYSVVAKPINNEKRFSEDRMRCANSEEGEYYDNKANLLGEFYKPHPKLEPNNNKHFDFNLKRSLSDDFYNYDSQLQQKRQVGVIYRDDRPIGILQPFQRSYRFIPVKDESASYGYEPPNALQEISYMPNSGMGKRDIGAEFNQYLDDSYPAILTNFRIDSKLDKKRNNNEESFADDDKENIRNLKSTIRKLRASKSHSTEQIEERLKNILDDMGLIEDDEVGLEKRELPEEAADNAPVLNDPDKLLLSDDREKRDETCAKINKPSDNTGDGLLTTEEKKDEIDDSMDSRRQFDDMKPNEKARKKRQKEEKPSSDKEVGSELVETLKDSGDIMVSGNRSPLASGSEITEREIDEDNDYEKRIERNIQSKINSLKEEVKREIAAIRETESSDDDDDDDGTEREKRQVLDNLADEENDDVNPVMSADADLKPLIRKRRTINAEFPKSLSRIKRHTTDNERMHDKRAIHKKINENNMDVGDLLDDDDFDDGINLKRQIFYNNRDQEYADLEHEDENLEDSFFDRDKRSNPYKNDDNYFLDEDSGERTKRENFHENEQIGRVAGKRFFSLRPRDMRSSRFRRRISEEQSMDTRPQQLSDMSDLDIFGALPKSYSGELSRYKRVKRK